MCSAWRATIAGRTKTSTALLISSRQRSGTARAEFDRTIIDWADSVQPEWLAGEMTYFSGAIGREVTAPRWMLVTHLFNHQTHHRGQVHCMLTQAGGKPSDTDLPFLQD
jgi:uncharacterized damage-inducible protein DinB